MSGAVRVPVTGGYVALVDEADEHLIAGVRWNHLRTRTGRIYAYGRSTATRKVYMHRLILATPAGFETDHVNGDGLDNRRSNLRVATLSQNSANIGKPQGRDGRPSTSRFKGVYRPSKSRGWAAQIGRNYLGLYPTEKDAARAYDRAAVALWGEFANTNLDSDDIDLEVLP